MEEEILEKIEQIRDIDSRIDAANRRYQEASNNERFSQTQRDASMAEEMSRIDYLNEQKAEIENSISEADITEAINGIDERINAANRRYQDASNDTRLSQTQRDASMAEEVSRIDYLNGIKSELQNLLDRKVERATRNNPEPTPARRTLNGRGIDDRFSRERDIRRIFGENGVDISDDQVNELSTNGSVQIGDHRYSLQYIAGANDYGDNVDTEFEIIEEDAPVRSTSEPAPSDTPAPSADDIDTQIARLEEQRRAAAERRREYRSVGDEQGEAREASEMARLSEEIAALRSRGNAEPAPSDTRASSTDDIDAQIARLEEQRRAAAERRREYRSVGDEQGEAREASEMARLSEEIAALRTRNNPEPTISNETETRTLEGTGTDSTRRRDVISIFRDNGIDITDEQIDELVNRNTVTIGDRTYTITPIDGGANDYGDNVETEFVIVESRARDRQEPTPSDTPEPTPSDTPEPTPTDRIVPTPTDTPTPTPTDTPTPTPTDTPTPTPTDTPTPTPTDTPTPTPTDTPTPTPTDTPTPTPTDTPTPTPTDTPVRAGGEYLPKLSFFEVVAKTDTVHIGNIEGKMHTLARQPIFRTGIIESIRKKDPVGLVTGLIPKTLSSIVMLGPKLVSKAVCAVRGTNRKVQELRDNIAALSPEEFRTLTEDNGNDDYSLNPITMTAFKLNDKYLEAIKGRVDQERTTRKAHIQHDIDELTRQKDALEQAIASGSLSPADQALAIEAAARLSRGIASNQYEMQRQEQARLAFEDGMDLKSSRKKNIEGWIAAAHNPDNITSHKQMAHYSEEIRKARAIGDYERELELVNDRKKYIQEQTRMVMGHISRGNYQRAQVTMSREQQTKGREILTSAAILASAFATIRAAEIERAKVSEQQRLDQDIQAHNAGINAHNQQLSNQNLQQQQIQQQIQGAQIDDKTIQGAVNYQQVSDAANIRMQREGIFLNNGGAQTGSWSRVNDFDPSIQAYDAATHAQEGTLVSGIGPGAGSQAYSSAFSQSVDNMTRTFGDAHAAEAAYQAAAGHAAFDVSRFMDATTQAQAYSGAFKQFFSEALNQNDLIQSILKTMPTQTTAAQQMGGFTIDIPSALIPMAAALVANSMNAYQQSESAAQAVAKEYSERQKKREERKKEKEQKREEAKEAKRAAKEEKKKAKEEKKKADAEDR